MPMPATRMKLEATTTETPVMQETVLVVEDSAAEQVRLTAMLKKFGYRVVTARNGAEAVALLREQPVCLVLSDWHMPEMSGLDLCRQLQAEPAFGNPYFILVTGRNTTSDLVAGMDAGANDFITKPFNVEELRVRVQAGARVIQLRREVAQRTGQLAHSQQREEHAQQRIQDDIDAVAAMQRAVRPGARSPFPQVEIATMVDQADVLAGDSFGFFRLDERHLGFYHAAIPASDIVGAMQGLRILHYLSPAYGSATWNTSEGRVVPPEEVVAGVSRRFLDSGGCRIGFTMIYGVLNVETGAGRLCQAGHPEPLLATANGMVRRFAGGGYAIGKDAEAMYQGVDFQLDEGDRLFVYSPGIESCTDKDGRHFGHHLLSTLLANSSRNPLPGTLSVINELIRHWHDDVPLTADVSAIAMSRKPAG